MTTPTAPEAQGLNRTGLAASGDRPSESVLFGVGCAVPKLRLPQAEACEMLIDLWNLPDEQAGRARRIGRGSGVDYRHVVHPMADVMAMGTGERMTLYETLAPPLAEQAARNALLTSQLHPQHITDLIVVSCTGFSAPGVDTTLIERLGLRPTVQRTVIGFMGCFGGIVGLRTAAALTRADPNRVALVVCVELCSLHLQRGGDGEALVTASLFADGAAAAVVGGEAMMSTMPRHAAERSTPNGKWRAPPSIGHAQTVLVPDAAAMSWRISDHGFVMTLARYVPEVIGKQVKQLMCGTSSTRSAATYLVHPGGPHILRAVRQALALDDGLPDSVQTLRSFGNMSSATIYFVLEEAMRQGRPWPVHLMAFGPGLTVEMLQMGPPRLDRSAHEKAGA